MGEYYCKGGEKIGKGELFYKGGFFFYVKGGSFPIKKTEKRCKISSIFTLLYCIILKLIN